MRPHRHLYCAIILALAVLVPAAFVPATVAAPPPPVAPGTSKKIVLELREGGFRRSFRLHVPAGLNAEPRPLVLALHGGFATGRILEKQSAFSEVADRYGFLVAYPNGFGFFSVGRHWNGGYCCAKAMRAGFDDLGFLDRVTEWIAERYAVDRARIYLVGYSNGGMLAHWYAAERADRLAGLGIFASSIGSLDTPQLAWTWPEPRALLPVYIAHGKSDGRLPYETPTERKGQKLLGAVASARAWARAQNCDSEPRTSTRREGAVERQEWCGDASTPVVFLGLADWGHDWPGPQLTDRLGTSEPLKGFHLAEEMWRFFSAGSR